MASVALEISGADEATIARLDPRDLVRVRRLCGAADLGVPTPMADAVARRLRDLGVPLLSLGRELWRLDPVATIREVPAPAPRHPQNDEAFQHDD